MKVRAIIFGASGMVGRGVLMECLESTNVEYVLMINRNSIGIEHPKLKEIIHSDFLNLSDFKDDLTGFNACFWTLGISAMGLSEKEYNLITYTYTLSVAKLLAELNSNMTFCYVSGAGTDSTEKGRIMWARIKGKTENELLRLSFNSAYMFRPGYIQPLKGVKSRTAWYNALYVVFKPLYPVMNALFPNSVTDTVRIGLAMINCVLNQPEKSILNAAEINLLAH